MARITWRGLLWCFVTGHSRWVVRYQYADGIVMSPDFYSEAEARARFNADTDHLSDDLVRLELIDAGHVLETRNFWLARGHDLREGSP